MTAVADPQRMDPVALFERHRAELRRQRMGTTVLGVAAFLILLGFSIWVSGLTPERLAEGAPRIFEYFGTVMPSLEWDKLFVGRTDSGNAVEGSLTFWYTDIDKYLTLIFETILMAMSATILGTAGAFALSFAASENLAPNRATYFICRRIMEVCRGVPEILLALIFVFMVGIGPLAGVIAVAIHSAGALGKLFAEVNENASEKPIEGIAAVGGNWVERMVLGVVPPVGLTVTS